MACSRQRSRIARALASIAQGALDVGCSMLGVGCFSAFLTSAIAEPDRDDPAAELASFKLPPGFQANLFASEKDGVIKPIQIRWDTRGRLWVIQSTTYPQLKPGEEPNDKVLILEDTDGDGVCDKTTVFADGLMIPTGLEFAPTPQPSGLKTDGAALFQSACYVGEGTKLLLLTDTDGDGKCDKREVVLRGFGTGDNHQNINSFRWSPGGELFFSQGLHAHARIETAYGIVPLDEAGFWRYRPREGRLDSFYGGPAEPQNPWGFVWTDWGQPLICAGNNGGIYWPLPEMIRGYRYGKRDQIWENARGRKSSGPDIVGTAHLPDDWQGTLLTGGYISNAVWALRILDDGAGFKVVDREAPAAPESPAAAKTDAPVSPRKTDEANPAGAAPPKRSTQALVTSTHGSFRCVDVKIGPDGAIYLCDWYNPIIGHYQSSFRHPDRDKKHGRIWRITYKDRPLVKPPKIAGAKLEELFENLKSGERWVREMTRLELMGRKTEEVVKMARAASERLSFEHAGERRALCEILGVVESHSSMDFGIANYLMRSRDPNVCAYLAGALARWHGRPWDEGKFDGLDKLLDLSFHPHPRVRLAAIVAAANIPHADSIIATVSAANPESDKFIDFAARSAVAALKSQLEPLAARGFPDWQPEWRERLAELQRPPGSPKPAPSPKSADKITATVAATGKLRATPEFVAALVQEVRESGDAKHGGEVFRRAELACTACHRIADQGGKIGPPLDTIGSGQPVDFIIGATLEPQREIKESYEALQLTAKDGRTALGYLAARDPQHTTLRDPATGAETKFANADIQEQKQLGSFMPAGLVDNLPREDLRDLFRYLSELGKPRQ
jgi:putative membrane-bound dehydrogenase-like protein